MNGGILDIQCDARASIEVKSPLKVATQGKDLSVPFEDSADNLGVGGAPSPLPSEHDNADMLQGIPNQALINRLLVSLDSLKAKSSHYSSGTTSPSPLTGSADRVPSSPTEVARYDFSPAETISREHSAECLAAAVQAMSLNQQQGLSFQRSAPLGPPGATNPNTQMPWRSSTFPSQVNNPQTVPGNPFGGFTGVPQNNPAAPYHTPGIRPHQNHSNHLGTSLPSNPFLGMAGADPVAAFAAYHALYAGQLGPHSGLCPHAFPPQPVFEECLVGIDGAYQPYCRQIISEELNVVALRMLSNLKNLQLADPPALTRIIGKRYFCSLKEVSKVVHSSRMLIVAPDVRPSSTAHIKPVRLLQMVLNAADAAGVPYVFAASRRGIGQVFGRDKSMSIVAIMQLDQVESDYLALLEQATAGRELYAMHRGGGGRRC